ncbi:DUF6036 family nucleotidyltransferase [Anaeromusa acidaminophila]|uniref:DUF6036 family nucleotidyltransferase n=1 Tax=Anaeromusa acidaminophila TaxID=81464 RepID=UPI0003714A8D|nr:DUF6036 family nucleotidyltransferase [Anaeromusa acidaminophila]
MESRDLLIEAAQTEDPLKRQMKVAAIVSDELEKRGTQCVMVGGSAVEFYTVANYMTQDLDMVATHSDDIKDVMISLGFKNKGGTWHLPEYPHVIVEFPEGPLDGRWDRVRKVLVNDKLVRIISVEDILVDRAAAVKFWGDPDEWVKYIMVGHYETIDWKYLSQRAKEADCQDIITKSKRWATIQRKEFNQEYGNG